MKPFAIQRLEERIRRLEHLELLIRRVSNFVGEELVEARIERREANNIAIATSTGIRQELIEDCVHYGPQGECYVPEYHNGGPFSDIRCDGPCAQWKER